ncbi:MAG: SET domain-containing protein-lysine N-methyltransferase [bacterium]|nr:SET domain-containing protein-lysine N-methyltransferase [bacterium]
MKNGIIVKRSRIQGKGIFAARDFEKGEVVLKWKPKILNKPELVKLSEREKHFIYKAGKNKYFLEQPPERYVNHSCDANTSVKNLCDVAIRNIRKGEEMTSYYKKESLPVGFVCKCGSKKCKRILK